MTEAVKGPVLLRFLKWLLLIFGSLYCFSLLTNVGSVVRSPSVRGLVVAALNFGAVVLFMSGVTGIANRKNYGRWCGAGSFAILSIIAFSALDLVFSGSGFESRYLTQTQTVILILGQVILFATASAYLAFSQSVNDHLTPTDKTIASEPPPPPSFDGQ